MQINVLVFALYLTSQEADSDLILVKKLEIKEYMLSCSL